MFCECRGFIYSFEHIKYFQIHTSILLATHILANRSSTVLQLPPHLARLLIVTKFIRFQRNSVGIVGTWLIIHRYTFCSE